MTISQAYFTNQELRLVSFRVEGSDEWQGASLSNPEHAYGENELLVVDYLNKGGVIDTVIPDNAPTVPVLTAAEKLEAAGLTVDELKELLGL